jgi:hypothetical protein
MRRDQTSAWAAVSMLVLFLVSLAASAQGPAQKDWGAGWIKTEIYFGRDLAGGHEIGRGEWDAFLDKVVTKRFPKGLTVCDAYGQMQHADGRIERQSTYVVIIVHPEDAASERAVSEIVGAFRKQFGNPQVMVLSSAVKGRFFAD